MSNNNAEIKIIKYYGTKQYFVETDARTGEIIKDSSFRIKPKSERIIHNDMATIVILDDGSKGVSKCMPEDEYNKIKGIKIAYLRAKIKSLHKELKVLTK